MKPRNLSEERLTYIRMVNPEIILQLTIEYGSTSLLWSDVSAKLPELNV